MIAGLSTESFYAGKVILFAGFALLFMAITVLIGVGGTTLNPGEGDPGFIWSSDFRYLSSVMGGRTSCMLSAPRRVRGPYPTEGRNRVGHGASESARLTR